MKNLASILFLSLTTMMSAHAQMSGGCCKVESNGGCCKVESNGGCCKVESNGGCCKADNGVVVY